MSKVQVEYELDNGWRVAGIVEREEADRIFRDPSDPDKMLTGFGPTDQVVVVLPPGVLVRGDVRDFD